MDKFTLTITLGNEAMQTGSDIAALLRRLASKIDNQDANQLTGGKLMDLNGNCVGKWDI